ncbi:Major histocompatibility complex class I-related gene protein [Merluccius polli]|uniref:Major histocompatibility complex class I-related gene protein n=1 Tax=Merluccius polli TaxID=89951 RepID=A0AA47N857_MERPO|nr:Major histocompatibility complex class I-related gene protein [Merluccius polli]
MEMKALIGLLLLVGCHGVSSVIHSLKYFSTASSGISNIPEFVRVAMLDEVQIHHYDSKRQKVEAKQSWMDQVPRERLEKVTRMLQGEQQLSKANIEALKRLFNQTGGVHTVQVMFGCEWDDEDDSTDGFEQHGYDGEDFLALDLKTWTWTSSIPEAVLTKLSWNQNRAELEYKKYFYTKECVDDLKNLLAYGKSALQRTERPEVSLLQRRPSSPVVCHATGFYPDRVVVFWRRDGDELYEHVDHGEVLPNPDGTFQVSVDLDLVSVPREDWRRYECVVQLKGIEDILTRLDPALIRTNWGKTGPGRGGVIHSLKLFTTASSGISSIPEFVHVVMLDEVQIYHYDSNSQKLEFKQPWMDQVTREELEVVTRILQGNQQVSKANIEALKERFNQTGGVHTFQVMYGCEWDDEDDSTDGFEQHGYDGEDSLALDLKTWTWTSSIPEADSIKLSWNQDRARLEYKKYFYTKACVDWLKAFLACGKSTLQRTERPEVSLLQRRPSSPVVCHATGFYPDRVVVFWRRDGEELYEHVDHGEVLPNPDGTFQVSVDLDLASVPREDWGRYECVVQLKGIEDILTRLDPALVRTNWGKTGPGRGGDHHRCSRCCWSDCVQEEERFCYLPGCHSSSGNSEEQSPAPEVQPLNTVSILSSSNSMEMKALIGLLLLVGCHGVSSVIHSLKYFSTASSGVSNIPEFVSVLMLDEVQIHHYDSNRQKLEVKQSWMDQLPREDLEEETRILQGNQQVFKAHIENLKELFKQTGGVHTYQVMYGCEWDDEDDSTDGFEQHGYDGEDFLVLDLKTWTWTSSIPEADSIKLSWNQDRAQLEYTKNFLTKDCVYWLKKLLANGKSALQRTERPEVSLLQRRPSSPVVCHATGFYPDRVVVFWRRDGEELYEHVDQGEVLPNPDGTFQVSVDLDLASVPREDWGRYECVVQLKGIEDILTPLDPALIRTNWGKTGPGRDGGRNT